MVFMGLAISVAQITLYIGGFIRQPRPGYLDTGIEHLLHCDTLLNTAGLSLLCLI